MLSGGNQTDLMGILLKDNMYHPFYNTNTRLQITFYLYM